MSPCFTANNIFCIGRNYAEHARELSNPIPSEPLVFLKPNSALTYTGSQIHFPVSVGRVDHEVEWVLVVKESLNNNSVITEQTLPSLLMGMAIGIDVTARDLQEQAKKKGQPWTLSKGLPTFAALGPIVPFFEPVHFEILINGEKRQSGSSKEMLFGAVALVKHLANTFGLRPNDLIFTGTPKGVGPLHNEDSIIAQILETPSRLELTVQTG